MRRRAVALGLAGLLVSAVAAGSPPQPAATVRLDPAKTHITFTLGAFLHTVHGRIALTRGGFEFNPASGTASGEIVIDAASATTGNTGRDRTMHNQVLETRRFPEIVFRPARVAGRVARAGNSSVILVGTLRLHGNGHAVRLPAQVHVDGGAFTASTRIEIPYVAWGLKNPSSLFLRVAKTVTVKIAAAGTIRWPPAAAAANN